MKWTFIAKIIFLLDHCWTNVKLNYIFDSGLLFSHKLHNKFDLVFNVLFYVIPAPQAYMEIEKFFVVGITQKMYV